MKVRRWKMIVWECERWKRERYSLKFIHISILLKSNKILLYRRGGYINPLEAFKEFFLWQPSCAQRYLMYRHCPKIVRQTSSLGSTCSDVDEEPSFFGSSLCS